MHYIENLVSIITPSYNSSCFVDDCIRSIQSQTYKSWELLIVDDCSDDDSAHIVSQYAQKDDRIKLFVLKNRVGPAAARNFGIEKAKGQYMAFLDSDDIWLNDKLERQLAFMQRNNYAFTYSSYYTMTEAGSKKKNVHVPASLTYNQYLKNTIIGCLTVVIDRSITGDFRFPLLKISHDMALWLSIMKKGIVAYGLDEVLAGYRLVATSNTSSKWESASYVWKIYREIEMLSFWRSFYSFVSYAIRAVIKRL